MVTTVKERRARDIKIPIQIISDQLMAARNNVGIQSTLQRARLVEMDGYTYPLAEGEVFKRRVVLIKRPRTKDMTNEDLPDLEDVQLTDWPWQGDITFTHASRQFRSKNAFSAMVQVVRHYDGLLYLLYDAATPAPMVDQLAAESMMYQVYAPTARTGFWSIKPIRIDQEWLKDAPAVPEALEKELNAIYFYREGNDFVLRHIDPEFNGRRLIVRLIGTIQVVEDTSKCLASA